MKKILINAISIKEGGGVVVLIKLLEEMLYQEKNIHWFVVIDDILRSKINKNERLTILSFPWTRKSSMHLFYWYEFILPRLVKKLKVDCVFSQTNILPIRKLPCSSFLLLHHAGYFSNEYISLYYKFNRNFLNRLGWKMRSQTIYRSIKKANLVTVQTNALAKKIIDRVKIGNSKLVVIPHGAGIAIGEKVVKNFPNQKAWRIGYITKYGVQKNFEVLFRAFVELKKSHHDIKLILTLDTDHGPFQHVKNLIEKYDLTDMVENHGEINESKIQQLYSSLDLFLFPSLCESFGFTLVEAMYYGLPIIAADTYSNREILGEQGEFFKSHSHLDLVNRIISLMRDETYYLKLSANSINQSILYSWKNTANKILELLKNMG